MDNQTELEGKELDLALYAEGLSAKDFETEKPYAYLYSLKMSRFEQRRAMNMLVKIGKKLGVSSLTIKQYWNDFLADQRPSQPIGSNFMTEFPEQEKVLGKGRALSSGKYQCDERGVTYLGDRGAWTQVISHPILPIKRIVDVETNAQNLKVAWCRIIQGERDIRAEWKEMIVPRETLASAQRIIGLAKNGIAITSENAKEVVKYLSDMENGNYSMLDTQLSCSHMGWLPDGQFAPYTENVVFGGDSDEFAGLYAGFHPCGDEQTWMDTAKAVRNWKSVPARIALAASFAAPLVRKLNALCFFVHFWGLQGSGKTVALLLAASVWGNPEIGKYIKSFSGTKVSQELFAAFCGNLPVLLDELQVISDRKTFDDIIYSLCEGVSKGRGAKDGGLQTSRRWSTVFLTTGEMPIVQSNSGGGAAVRTIEVNYGGEPFFEDARTVAETLKQNYGFAGRRYIAALQDEDTMRRVQESQKTFYRQLSGDIQDKQVLSASVLLAADKLAEEVLFHDGKALTVEDIKPYLITQEQADVNQRCYQYLIGWIASNQKRFSKDPVENNGEPWGLSEEEDGKEVVYIIRGAFEKALREGGYSPGAFLSWAKRKGYLKTQRQDSNTVQKTIGKIRPLCVAVYIVTPEEDKDDDASKDSHETKGKGWTVTADGKDLTVPSGYVEVEEDDQPLPF